MKTVGKGVQWLNRYAVLLVLGVTVGCESWDLPLLTNGLVAYYPLNGNPADVSGNDLNGQLINGALFGPDRKGNAQSALLLDGIDDYFEIPDNARLRSDSISISLWLKARQVIDALNNTRHIYNKDNYVSHENQQYSAFMGRPRSTTTGTACCELLVDVNNDGACVIEQPLKNWMSYYKPDFELNKWYHFVTVFSGQTIRLYINSELKMIQHEDTTNPIDPCVGGNLRFGAQAAYDSNNFDGMMDEIRIYNRGLTQAEITALYQR